jgi:ferrochelatase
MANKAVVLMYYGFPSEREEMESYLRDILHGKDPPGNLIEENLRKLDIIGGKSPSGDIVRNIEKKLNSRLEDKGFKIYLLTKHYKPSIKEASKIVGEKTIFEVPLFPVYSNYIFDGYFDTFESQFTDRKFVRIVNLGFEMEMVDYYRKRIDEENSSLLTFSAHSVPIVETDDPYSSEIKRLSALIAGKRKFINIYHSQGPFHPKWLTPEPEYCVRFALEAGYGRVRLVPIGFIYDHIEVLYDLDFQLRNLAIENGIGYERVPLPNDSDCVIDAISNLILRNEQERNK